MTRLALATAAAALLSTAAHAATEPTLTAGRVLTPAINVTQAPGFPVVELTINTGTVGLSSLLVSVLSPSGQHSVSTSFVNPPVYPAPPKVLHLKVAIVSSFTNQGFGLYTEPGAWSVQSVTFFNKDSTLTNVSGTQLAALFANASTIQVTNPASPDVTPPKIDNATILTPTVSLSATTPVAAIRIPAIDTGSGLTSAFVNLSLPGVFGGLGLAASLTAPADHADLIAYTPVAANTQTGTYTITSASVCDYAGNCAQLNTPSAIAAHFSTTTITVTK